ncbi:MAG: cytochrome c [Minwuia sp.]|nr:cytochrome c [Minwuia sp.]
MAETTVEKGAYLVRAGGCLACHTAKKDGVAYAGGHALKTPFGTFYSPNITPDPDHGIGRWSDDDFVRALHEGVAPDGGRYFPVFPYGSYTRMTRDDALAIKAFLFSLDPVAQPNREHDVSFPFSWRFMQRGWRTLFFDEGRFEPDPAQSAEWNRGAYLVDALTHCGECHTPRNVFGGLKRDQYMSGTVDGPENQSVPNITPHATGIGDWGRGDLVSLLKSGMKPDFDNVQGTMAEAIDDGLKYLTDADLQAIETYIYAIEPIENTIAK